MRISTSQRYDATIANLEQRQQSLSSAQVQLTSGKRVNNVSDDPTAAAQAERALAAIARGDANKRSVDASRTVMTLTEGAMGEAVNLLQQARETMVGLGNGTHTLGERQILAGQLRDIREQLLTIANRSDGSGGFVFGGQGSSSPPFFDTPGGVTFVGQGGETQASTSDKTNLTVDGEQVWLRAKTGNGVFNTSVAANVNTGLANTGTGWINAGSVVAPAELPYPAAAAPAPSYAVQFHVSAGVTTYDILENGTPLTAGAPYVEGQPITITGRGMGVTIMGKPGDGDSFAVKQADNTLNAFSSLDKAINALNSPVTVPMQTVDTGLVEMDSLLGNLEGARSAVGESLNRMDGMDSRISALKLAAQTERSNAEDLDMTAAISDFQNKQTGYEAALRSYAMVQKLSLFQYING